MEQGTTTGLLILVTLICFGILAGLVFKFVPQMQEVAELMITNGTGSTPTPKY